MEIIRLMGMANIFHGFDEEQLGYLSQFLEAVPIKRDDCVVREGDQADAMFIIWAGTAAVWMERQGQQNGFKLADLVVGDCFGEMSLVDCQTRSASVCATSDMKLAKLPQGALETICEDNPKIFGLLILNIAREISRRLRRSDRTQMEFSVYVDMPTMEDSYIPDE